MMVSVILPDEICAQLDAIKERTGISISLMIRRMVESHLAKGDPLQFSLSKEEV